MSNAHACQLFRICNPKADIQGFIIPVIRIANPVLFSSGFIKQFITETYIFLLNLHKITNMGTITIKSDKPDDLYFIRELARRLNLKNEITTTETETSIDSIQPTHEEDEAVPLSAVDGIIEGMKEVRAHQKGNLELGTLGELIQELENEG